MAAGACGEQPSLDQGLFITLVNLSDDRATLEWQTPGPPWLPVPLGGGRSGTFPIEPCSDWNGSLQPGKYSLTLTTVGDSTIKTAEVPGGSRVDVAFVINADGSVTEVPFTGMATRPACPVPAPIDTP